MSEPAGKAYARARILTSAEILSAVLSMVCLGKPQEG